MRRHSNRKPRVTAAARRRHDQLATIAAAAVVTIGFIAVHLIVAGGF